MEAHLRRGWSQWLAALGALVEVLRRGRSQRLQLELRCSWLQQLPLEAAASEVQAHLRCGWSQRPWLELHQLPPELPVWLLPQALGLEMPVWLLSALGVLVRVLRRGRSQRLQLELRCSRLQQLPLEELWVW